MRRAESAGLIPCGSLDELVSICPTLVSVCPPDAAEEVAADVASAGFDGIYVDANALAPQTARRIGERLDHFVDGVGPRLRHDG